MGGLEKARLEESRDERTGGLVGRRGKGTEEAGGAPPWLPVTFLLFQSQSSWAWATEGRWRSSTRWRSRWGSCCSPGWPTRSLTGAGSSWPSLCPPSSSCCATGTVSSRGPRLPGGLRLTAICDIWGVLSQGSPHAPGALPSNRASFTSRPQDRGWDATSRRKCTE